MLDRFQFESKKNLELKKNVGLIHSTNHLSLLERKIANALLYNAYDKLMTDKEHTINLNDLCKLIGYNSKDQKTIKKALISLMSSVLEWNIIESSKGSESDPTWIASTFLADAKIERLNCTYSYSNRMKELCYHPKIYGKINIHVLAKFKSSYALALYENCIRYQGVKVTPWLGLNLYRKLMGVNAGIYSEFKLLRRKVIEQSILEVNMHSPISVEAEFKKCGRVITEIRFHIKNKDVHLEESEESKICSVSKKLIEEYNISKIQALDFLSLYEEQYINEKIKIIESSSSFKNGKIKNISRYLEKALKEDFKSSKGSEQVIKDKVFKKDIAEKIEKRNKESIIKYKNFQNEEIWIHFSKIPEHEELRRKIDREFESRITKGVYSSLYYKEKFGNILVKDQLVLFIREKYPEILDNIPTYDEYCEANKFKIYTSSDTD